MPRRPKLAILRPEDQATLAELARLAPAFTWRTPASGNYRGDDGSGFIRIYVHRGRDAQEGGWSASFYIDPTDDPWTFDDETLPGLVRHVWGTLDRQRAILAGALAGMGGVP